MKGRIKSPLGKGARGMHVTALKEDTCPVFMQKILIYSACRFKVCKAVLPDIVLKLGGTAVIKIGEA